MNPLFEAALELEAFFKEHHLTYAVIGGFAVQKWGDIRFTKDVDITIAASLQEGAVDLVNLITEHFSSRIQEPLIFARRTRMILIRASNGIAVDISLAIPGYEDQMMVRAIEFEIEPGKSIRICSAEDLIIHKAVAGRPQDIADIQGIVYRQGDRLDLDYIRRWLKEFADALGDAAVQERFESAWQRYQESS